MLNSYIIKNGTLISILTGNCRQADILVENGVITKIEEHIHMPAVEIFDASGMYVSIGWLDAHTHFAAPGTRISLIAEQDILRQGVTYALDLGTLGPENYTSYRKELLYTTNLRFRSYLNISNFGVAGVPGHTMDFESSEDIQPEKVKAVAEKYRHELVGLKARIDDKFCFDPDYVMKQLRALGDELDMPIAVHAPRSRIGIDNLLPYLKKGDVLCHTLAGNSDVMKVIDENGNIKKSVLEARKRGVIFDLSHGTNAYSYETAEAAWKAGFFVDTISSDLHGGNINGPVFSLAAVLTKMRGLTGKPWSWILEKTIVQPVKLLKLTDKAVEVCEGMRADLTIYKIEEGQFTYLDSKKLERTFSEKITPCYTCIGDHVYTCRQ